MQWALDKADEQKEALICNDTRKLTNYEPLVPTEEQPLNGPSHESMPAGDLTDIFVVKYKLNIVLFLNKKMIVICKAGNWSKFFGSVWFKKFQLQIRLVWYFWCQSSVQFDAWNFFQAKDQFG